MRKSGGIVLLVLCFLCLSVPLVVLFCVHRKLSVIGEADDDDVDVA